MANWAWRVISICALEFHKLQMRSTYTGVGTQRASLVVGEAASLGGTLNELIAEERGRVAGIEVGRVSQLDARTTEDLLVPCATVSDQNHAGQGSGRHSLSPCVTGANVVL